MLWNQLRDLARKALDIGLQSDNVATAAAGYNLISAMQDLEKADETFEIGVQAIPGFGDSPGGTGLRAKGGIGIVIDPARMPQINRLAVLGHEIGHAHQHLKGVPLGRQWEGYSISMENRVRKALGCARRSQILSWLGITPECL